MTCKMCLTAENILKISKNKMSDCMTDASGYVIIDARAAKVLGLFGKEGSFSLWL